MATVFKENWTLTQAVLATINPRCLTKGNFKSATLDLTNYDAARLHIGIGKGGTTAFAVGVKWLVRDVAAPRTTAAIVSGQCGLTARRPCG